MKLIDVGVVIAERILNGQVGGKPCAVVVKIGTPLADDAGGAGWYCPYSITIGSEQRIFYGAGVDSLQALRIAIKNIAEELNTIYRDLKLTWMGDTDLGFSVQL